MIDDLDMPDSRDQETIRESTRGLLSWVELRRDAFRRNVDIFKRILGRSELWPVLKANAYGHGLRESADVLAPHANGFAVFNLDEAAALRAIYPDLPLLVLGPVPEPRLAEASALGVQVTAATVFQIRAMAACGKPLPVHVKLETGTNRQGIRFEELDEAFGVLRSVPTIVLAGLYTHFANIEDTTDHTFAMNQLGRFVDTVQALGRAGIRPAKVHAACSAAALLFPDALFDLSRIGISIYGLWPSPQTKVSFKHRFPGRQTPSLAPVLSWKARVTQIREVPEGEYIGYSCSFRTTRRSRIGVLGVGYSDGYDRRLSNQAFVLVRGKRAPIRGKVCMNVILVDVTDIPDAEPGDEAVLLGSQGKDKITAEDLAVLIGTINYEVVSRIGPHLPRIVV